MFRAIQERVYYLYREKKQLLILAIDEAQYLNYNILRDLKMLMKHCANGSRFIIIMRDCRTRKFRTISIISWNRQEAAEISWKVERTVRFMGIVRGMRER